MRHWQRLSKSSIHHARRTADSHRAGGNRFDNHCSGPDSRARSDFGHHDSRRADPAILSDDDFRELAMLRSLHSPFGVASMLPPATENLYTAGDLGPVTDGGVSQYAIGADIDAAANSGLRARKEGAELNPGFQRTPGERQLVIRDAKIITHNTRNQRECLREEQEGPLRAAETR